MNRRAWRAFATVRDQYRAFTEALGRDMPELRAAQQALVNRRRGPPYTVETPVVYNRALDDVHAGDDIRLILVADNPGRREQAAENRRYLVGPSGKIAEKFFRDNPALGIDFRRNVIILNKTPIHTPRTAELRELGRLSGPAGKDAIAGKIIESQRIMARFIREFHRALSLDTSSGRRSGPACPAPDSVPDCAGGTLPAVWITGYSEMGDGGIFETFTKTLREIYAPAADGPENQPGNRLFLFRHFSMNQFTIDLYRKAAGETVPDALARIGAAYRERFLGW